MINSCNDCRWCRGRVVYNHKGVRRMEYRCVFLEQLRTVRAKALRPTKDYVGCVLAEESTHD